MVFQFGLGGLVAGGRLLPMNGEEIRSVKNARLEILREAREGKELLVAEGVRLVGEGLEAGLPLVRLFVAQGLERSEIGRDLLAKLRREGFSFFKLSDKVLAKLSRLKTPQGVLAVFERPKFEDEVFFAGEDAFVLVAAGVRDPGNMGALLRVAEAAGAGGVFVLEGSADPFREKALRGAAGSAFRLPVRAGVQVQELLGMLKQRSGTLLGLDAHEGEDLFEADLGKAPRAYLLGGEGAGLPEELGGALDRRLRIPMASQVESLNVSVAAGIVLFEELRRGRRE
jgi:TrmH family RNA methyltransferase